MDHLTQDNSNRRTIARTESQLLRLARNLCEHGRFLEEKRQCLEVEKQDLLHQAKTLHEVIREVSVLLGQVSREPTELSSEINKLSELLSEICQPAKRIKEPDRRKDNVHSIIAFRTDRRSALGATSESDDESDSRLREISTHMLREQMRYILVYLGRAIDTRDATCLTRLADDLKDLSVSLNSGTLVSLAEELIKATKIENWNAIQLLHQTLSDELDHKIASSSCEQPLTLSKAS